MGNWLYDRILLASVAMILGPLFGGLFADKSDIKRTGLSFSWILLKFNNPKKLKH